MYQTVSFFSLNADGTDLRYDYTCCQDIQNIMAANARDEDTQNIHQDLYASARIGWVQPSLCQTKWQ